MSNIEEQNLTEFLLEVKAKMANITLSENEAINEINVVPYVDIMLVLLVIFMVVTPLAIQGLEINLPKTESKQLELEQSFPFVIDINDKGQYFIEEDSRITQVSLGFIEDRFSKVISSNPDLEVIIRGDGEADYESVAQLLSMLQENGGINFSLATQP